MSNKKATKRALWTSVMALAMCVVMLVGTTFAWFTDTAKTNVNKIQAGNLKVDIVDKSGNTLQNRSLSFMQTSESGELVGDGILWEPGCTFLTEGFKIVNKGNLALKYSLTISGATGNAKLLEAIKFDLVAAANFDTAKSVVAGISLDTFTGKLLPEKSAPVAEDGTEQLYFLRGHMEETAGNEYQNLTLNNIAITVNATQDTVEFDSNNNQYDKDAFVTVGPDTVQTALDNAVDGTIIQLTAGNYGTLYFRQSGKSELYTDKVIENDSGANVNDNGYIVVGEGRRDALYLRTLKNVTIIGAEGAVVDNIEFMTANYTYAADTEETVSGNTIYRYDSNIGGGEQNALRSYFNIENLTIKNVNFKGEKTAMDLKIFRPDPANTGVISQRLAIDGLHFDGCTMNAVGASSANAICLLKVEKTTDAHVDNGIDPRFKNVSITNCAVSNAQYVFNGCGIDGFTATGNTFKNSGYCDIVFNGSPDQSCAGDVTVTGNTSVGAYKYFLRIGDGTQLTLSMSGNTVTGLRAEGATAVKVGNEVKTNY